MNVYPDFDAVNQATGFATAIGALLTVVLIVSVLMLIVSAITWAICTSNGNYQGAVKARIGCFVAGGAAVLAGAGVAWANFLIGVGERI